MKGAIQMKETFAYNIKNPVGLYVDMVNALTAVAGRFQSSMTITYQEKTVNLKSMMGVLSLGVPAKAALVFSAEGADAKEAIKALKKCLDELKA